MESKENRKVVYAKVRAGDVSLQARARMSALLGNLTVRYFNFSDFFGSKENEFFKIFYLLSVNGISTRHVLRRFKTYWFKLQFGGSAEGGW